MLLKELISEAKKEKKKKIVFVEFDPKQPFPTDTVSALKKQISSDAKDLTKDWKSPQQLVDNAFTELKVPKPLAYLQNRFEQYTDLLKIGIRELRDARGFSDWTTL